MRLCSDREAREEEVLDWQEDEQRSIGREGKEGLEVVDEWRRQ